MSQLFFHNKYFNPILLFVVSFLLYANTLSHDFTQDDAIVIYDNMYTQKGLEGIPGLLKNDTFHGFFKTEGKAKLVSGGRYRPFTPIMFAIERELFGEKPFWGHFFNLVWYGFLSMILYITLLKLLNFKFDSRKSILLAFGATLLFIAHPVHTEVVANIKGRDEIIAMLGSIVAFYLILRPLFKTSLFNHMAIALIFFLASMSKENTVTFLAVIPLALVIFRQDSIINALGNTSSAILGFLLFFIIRTSVLGFDLGGNQMELMNNPFLKIENQTYVPFTFAEKMATIFTTMFEYFRLLLIPFKLTHDYYPYQIAMTTLSSPKALLGLLGILSITIFGLISLKKNSLISFSLLYYLTTLSIVSNVVFPIGTNMSERFLFMPSLGFTLLLSFILEKISQKKVNLFFTFLIIIAGLYSFKTITRNQIWKDDFTLFTTDVKTSTNSAKVLNAAGGALSTEAYKLEDGPKKTQMLQEATTYLRKAVKIHPNYKNAYLIMGNAYYFLGKQDSAIMAYELCLSIDPSYEEASKNLAIVLRDAGRKAGEVEGNLPKSIELLTRSEQLAPNDAETMRYLGVAYGISNQHQKAITYFKKVVDLQPNDAASMLNLSNAHKFSGNNQEAQFWLQKALSIDPSIIEK